jgi:YegS/Rv2252/BmrU family lipid kinase
VSWPGTALVIGRHRPGRPIESTVADVSKQLRLGGWTVRDELVEKKRELRQRTGKAVKRGVDVVVVVGGDGAIAQVATKLVGTDIPLGVIPSGTGNLFAGNYGIPGDVKDALATIREGHRRAIDVGMAEVDGKQRAFAIACGIGFDAHVMDATSRAEKTRFGKLAYLVHALGETAALRNARHTVTLDGEETTINAAQVFIANAGRMLPMLEPKPPVIPDDGLLDVIAVTAGGPVQALAAAWEATRQDELGKTDSGRVFRARARTIEVTTTRPRLVELDGSVLGKTPVRASVVPGGLCVLVPR